MKMTKEERESFYCLYYGQKVAKYGNQTEAVNVMCPLYSIDYIQLRSVEQLSGDELSVISGLMDLAHLQPDITRNDMVKDILNRGISEGTRGNILMWLQIFDQLRSIGVLVGFRHFTPEMLIAEGVVKLKA